MITREEGEVFIQQMVEAVAGKINRDLEEILQGWDEEIVSIHEAEVNGVATM